MQVEMCGNRNLKRQLASDVVQKRCALRPRFNDQCNQHYAKLGGRMLGFSVDKGFPDVLDGLVLVDRAKPTARFCSVTWARMGWRPS